MSKTVGAGPPSGDEAQTITVSAFAETILDDADAPMLRSTIGAGTSNFDGNYNSLTNQPVLFDGSFANLTGKPTTLSGYGITDGVKSGLLPLIPQSPVSQTVPTGYAALMLEGTTIGSGVTIDLQGTARLVFVPNTAGMKIG